MLAVDNASVRLARSHVHTGFTERLPGSRIPRIPGSTRIPDPGSPDPDPRIPRSPRSGIEAERSERRPDKAAAEIRNLGDRLSSLGAPGWTGRDGEWLALVCLHGGVFLRPQNFAFFGRSHPELGRRSCAVAARRRSRSAGTRPA
ncbi:MAG: hypothetical protein OXG04_20010 [Acidobacteria bacterium]|nr:hypothetical protein [Acidobacteriota bacterium]